MEYIIYNTSSQSGPGFFYRNTTFVGLSMRIIHDVPVRMGEIHDLTSADGDISFKRPYSDHHIPVILGIFEENLWELIHIFIMGKAASNAKDLKPTAKAFVSWITYLQERNISAFTAPRLHINHPTYGYKNELERRILANDIASTTAASYVNTIKLFYEMLVGLRFLPENVFFKYEASVTKGGRTVQSTDLRIRKRRIHGPSLNPIDKTTQKAFRIENARRAPMYRLTGKLMIDSGLRIAEACTLPAQIFTEEDLSRASGPLVRGVVIGPCCGCQTKFSKSRELFITTTLFEDILDFKESPTYLKRLEKWRSRNGSGNNYEPLWITNRGNQLTPSTFYSDWRHLKGRIKDRTNTLFDHRPHDLRATFATGFLGTAMKYFPNDIEQAIASTMYWMGHEHEATTLKYYRFLSRNTISNLVAEEMDSLVRSIMEA